MICPTCKIVIDDVGYADDQDEYAIKHKYCSLFFTSPHGKGFIKDDIAAAKESLKEKS